MNNLQLEFMPTYDELYQFIKKHYKHSRFEGMAGNWCAEYPKIIVDGYMKTLQKKGIAFISCHESYTGQTKIFNTQLEFIEDDRPPEERIEYNHSKGHISHIF